MSAFKNAVVFVKRDFAAHKDRLRVHSLDHERPALTRRNVERIRNPFRAVDTENRYMKRMPCRIPEVVEVSDGHLPAVFGKLERERLEHVLHLVVARLRRAVGENRSVHHELPVVRLVAEVAAVGDDEPVLELSTFNFKL